MTGKSLDLYRNEVYQQLAQIDLTQEDLTSLTEYIAKGGSPLAPETAAKLFELFLNGSSAREIQRLNKAYPLGSILDAQVRYKWTEKKEQYAIELQQKIKDRVLKAQLETTELMTDMLTAARRKHSDKLKKFIQSGNESDLDGVINIDSIQGLMKVTEGLLKITGQDKISKVKTENTQNLNVNVTSSSSDKLEPEDAAKILSILSEAKKKSNAKP
jgi:hypothetical protein